MAKLAVWVPVPPQEILLLLSDLRERISVAQMSKLLNVTVSHGMVTGQAGALRGRAHKADFTHSKHQVVSQFASLF